MEKNLIINTNNTNETNENLFANFAKARYACKTPEEVENFYRTFYNKEGNLASIDEARRVVEKAERALEDARQSLNLAYSKMYNHKIIPLKGEPIMKYSGRQSVEYFNLLGYNVFRDDVNSDYTTVTTKTGKVNIIVGACYEKAAIVVRRYKYAINHDNTRCNFILLGEFLIPFFESEDGIPKIYPLAGSDQLSTEMIDWYDLKGDLERMSAVNFLNKLFGVEKDPNIICMDLADAWEYAGENKAFEVIYKTCPDAIIRRMLRTEFQKSAPIHKLLNISKETYEKLIKLERLDVFSKHRETLLSPNFHYNESEWVQMIETIDKKEDDLEFFKIERGGYYYNEKGLFDFMLSRFEEDKDVFGKFYSFGKWSDYVIEESINQGYQTLYAFIRELKDYLKMCVEVDSKPTLYSSYLKQTHDIFTRNYNIKLEEMQEQQFAALYENDPRVDIEVDDQKYMVIPPKSSEDLKKEGSELNHCVHSYVKRILDGKCKIYFLRKKAEESLITLEVGDGYIKQARGSSNRKPTSEENQAISAYADKMGLKVAYNY